MNCVGKLIEILPYFRKVLKYDQLLTVAVLKRDDYSLAAGLTLSVLVRILNLSERLCTLRMRFAFKLDVLCLQIVKQVIINVECKFTSGTSRLHVRGTGIGLGWLWCTVTHGSIEVDGKLLSHFAGAKKTLQFH